MLWILKEETNVDFVVGVVARMLKIRSPITGDKRPDQRSSRTKCGKYM
jgi:hypothetical protein